LGCLVHGNVLGFIVNGLFMQLDKTRTTYNIKVFQLSLLCMVFLILSHGV
jgi:hypothetical protein